VTWTYDVGHPGHGLGQAQTLHYYYTNITLLLHKHSIIITQT